MNHGGDLLTYKDYYKGELVDFSSNINPLGPPSGLEEELIQSFNSLSAYPDIQYRKLKKEIGLYLGCGENNILVGNGAVEIINNFIIPAKRVIVVTPSFSEYEKRAIAHGKAVKKIDYNEDFTINIDAIEEVLEKDDLLILGNPNNPTGLRIEKDELINIYKLVKDKKAYLLLDEAFHEFCPEDYDSIELFKSDNYASVGIIRAATKFFGLPGIRLGYGCANEDKVKDIGKIELPWSVNSLADAAGQFIFKDRDYIMKSKAYIDNERRYLLKELSRIEGIKPYNTHTNYILIKLINWAEEEIFDFFLENGIVIRKCKSFAELSEDHVRVAIKDRANNTKLLNVFNKLKEIYKK